MTSHIKKMFWTGFTGWQGRKEGTLPYYAPVKIRHIQNRRIRAIVKFAHETVPFYRDCMNREKLKPENIKTAADLEMLPLISSNDLANDPQKFQSTAFKAREMLSLDTSGSTGRYKIVRHDKRALFMARAGRHRTRLVLSEFTGKSLGYSEVSVNRHGGTNTEILKFFNDHSWIPGRVRLKRETARPEHSFETNINVINRLRPDTISGFGSYIGEIYRWAWLHKLPIHRPKVISYGGDTLQEPDRKIIEKEFRIPVVSTYQACEALNIAFQCGHGDGFHISLDQTALRIVDSGGRPSHPGEDGEIVISNLINRATVLLNYRLGDWGRLAVAPCPCGRTLPLLSRLQGRANDVVVLTNGEVVHESVILPRLYAVSGVVQVQVIQQELTRFQIRVVCEPASEKGTVCQLLSERFLSLVKTTGQVSLDVLRVAGIPNEPSGKYRTVISHCARDA
jgi:phenylacetate-CoA ligase